MSDLLLNRPTEPIPPSSAAPDSRRAPLLRVTSTHVSVATLVIAATLGLLLLVLYYKVGIKLVRDWYELPDFSHGFLIPFFAAYLLWKDRHTLAGSVRSPSWSGLIILFPGLLLLVTGVLGADLFLSRFSLILVVAGSAWMLGGALLLRKLRFVLFVMLLGVPLPAVVFNQITFPLQMFASKVAGAVLPLLGVPVLRDGNIIELAAMRLEVAEACSGIRSLLSLFTLAVIYGYFVEQRTSRRVVLALASVPIAIAANVARIVGTGLCVQYWDPEKASGFFHEFSGWLMFVVSFTLMYLIHRLFQLAPAQRTVRGS